MSSLATSMTVRIASQSSNAWEWDQARFTFCTVGTRERPVWKFAVALVMAVGLVGCGESGEAGGGPKPPLKVVARWATTVEGHYTPLGANGRQFNYEEADIRGLRCTKTARQFEYNCVFGVTPPGPGSSHAIKIKAIISGAVWTIEPR